MLLPAFMTSWFAFWSIVYSRRARECWVDGWISTGDESELTAKIFGGLAYACLAVLLVVVLL